MPHLSRILSCAGGRRRVAVLATLLPLAAALLLAATADAGDTKVAGPRTVYDPSAAPNWELQVNGYTTSWDAATSVLADAGGAYVGGWAGNANGDWDATLARVSSTGEKKWLKRYDGPAHKNDLVWKLAKGPGGTVYGAGWTVAANGKTDVLVVKWKSDGTRVWAKTYDGSVHGDDRAVALGVDKYGAVTVAGSTTTANGTDYLVVKWASSGTRKFVWRYDGSAHQNDAATDIVVESGGTTYVTGNIKVAGPVDTIRTVKFSSAGSKLWAKSYIGLSALGANATCMTSRPGGGVYIGGWSQDLGADAKNYLMLRYASGGGVFVPQLVSGFNGDDVLADIAVTSTRSIVAVGYSSYGGMGTDEFHTRWASETAGIYYVYWGQPFDDALTVVCTDAFGGYYFAGYERTAANQAQIVTRRKRLDAPSTGFVSFWGPALNVDQPAGIASYGTTVYVVGVTATATEAWNQVVLIYSY
jgi:hypothetical protein